MRHNIRNIYILALSSSLALTACGDEEFDPAKMDISQKTPIEVNVGVEKVDGLTRAITVDKTPLSTLPTETSIYMVMKSEHVEDNSKLAKYTLTMGTTGAADNGVSSITFGDGYKRYWDDVYARKAALSIYAVCTPGGTPVAPTIGSSNNYSFTASEEHPTTEAWIETPNTLTISNWEVKSNQNLPTVAQFNDQDLCYSNNVSNYTVGETTTDNRIKFLSDSKKFDRTKRLNFYHALSKVTFIVKSGLGFYSFENDFMFSGSTNITMKKMNLKQASFDIASGEFSGDITEGVVSGMYQSDKKKEGNVLSYTLDALVIPGTDMSSTEKDISFSISDNLYELSKKDLLNQISDDQKSQYLTDGKSLKPGVHYIFTLTISKTEIKNITASVVAWETVKAEYTPTNARLTFSFENRGTPVTKTTGETFDIYRAANENEGSFEETNYFSYNWDSGFSNTGETSSDNGLDYDEAKWKTNWFWPNNKTFYHLRTVGIKGGTSSVTLPTVSTVDGKDCFSISASETFSDVIWGAPFKKLDSPNPSANTALLTYSKTEGFDGKGAEAETKKHQIYYAIGPTNQPIHIVMFHMISKVIFNVQTVPGDGAVSLGDGSVNNCTKLTLKNIHTTGKVLMGNGCVSATESRSDYSLTYHPAPTDSKITWPDFGAIPQDLNEENNEVVLVITTPDENIYQVKLADIWTESSKISTTNLANPYTKHATEDKYQVDYWYPHYEYTYTFTLSKKGIDNIQVTILDWEKVEASDDEVQIQ